MPLADTALAPLLSDPSPPRRRQVSNQGTDIAAALLAGLQRARYDAPQLLLLVSDGMSTSGAVASALQAAKRPGLSVRWWRPQAGKRLPDAWIRSIRAPTRVGAGETFAVSVTAGANQSMRAELRLIANGRLAARQEIDLTPGEPGAASFDLALGQIGTQALTVILSAPDDGVPENNGRSRLIETLGKPRILMISPSPSPSPVAESLRLGGWPLRRVRPKLLATGMIEAARLIILEQIPVTDLSATDWQTIARAVRREGAGLILLGGPDTFGLGGYRHSTLEELLPLIAEASRPLSPAAVLFAVDSSGSMDQTTQAGASRFQLARQAVTGSARQLDPADLVGLTLFEREPREVLPLQRHPDPAIGLSHAWDASPGGGTMLLPMIRQAARVLGGAAVEQRILVLVSDGRFADANDPEGPRSLLEGAGIDVIALAVGEDAQTDTLERLTRHGEGRLLRVADVAELPGLMQTEVGKRRSALEVGRVTPVPSEPLPIPGAPTWEWPSVGAYPVTRARQGAIVHLTAPNGDPLLAAHFAGAGLVLALPSGLGPWAPEWSNWASWGRFLGGLVQWAAAPAATSQLRVAADGESDLIRVRVDALEAGDWAPNGELTLEWRDPSGRWRSLPAEATAPGRFETSLPAAGNGRYDIRARRGARSSSLAIWHQPADELLPRAPEALMQATAAGLVQPWTPASSELKAPAGDRSSQFLLAVLALLVYLGAVVAERLPRWPGTRRPGAFLRRFRGAATHAD
jgi:hypothetical protein